MNVSLFDAGIRRDKPLGLWFGRIVPARRIVQAERAQRIMVASSIRS